MNGVSTKYHNGYQFISVDGTRSAFKDSESSDDEEWPDYIVPQGKQIRTVETLLVRCDGSLFGFKWIGDDGAVLLAVGDIDKPDWRNDPSCVVTSFTLNHN